MAQSGYLTQIAKSRDNLLAMLALRGFNVDPYKNQSVAQVHSMLQNDQLDMLLNNTDKNKKIYIKFHLGKTLRSNNIMDYIDDLYTLDTILGPEDDLIIVAKEPPNESLEKALRHIWSQHKYLISVFGLKSIQFNVLDHFLVPPHRVLSTEESDAIRSKYNIMNDSQLPDLSRFCPVALAIGIRPGEICEILRPSNTAITSKFYRICSP
jgi:DNA-directed RNA polymerase subunit H (RpoH/RPB5)/arginine repressor